VVMGMRKILCIDEGVICPFPSTAAAAVVSSSAASDGVLPCSPNILTPSPAPDTKLVVGAQHHIADSDTAGRCAKFDQDGLDKEGGGKSTQVLFSVPMIFSSRILTVITSS
jgi:hypothetical protein